MFRIQRIVLIFGVLLTFLAGLPPARPAQAQGRLCFPETNQCVKIRFLEYWQQRGGLPVFGYPTTPARQANPERGDRATMQLFDQGVMVWLTGTDFVNTFVYNSGAVNAVGRTR